MWSDLSSTEGRFIAGFIQAEGHFNVCEQNGGQSLSCRFALCVRDDDRDLVAWLQEATDLGGIRPVRARRGSAPQSAWLVMRRAELQSLVEMLERHPLYGRKAAEVAVWCAAVAAWTGDPPDRPAMRAALLRLQELRAYTDPDPSVDITLPPLAQFRHHLGGLIADDGHLSLSGGRPAMTLKQRLDDLPLLRAICREVGVGNVYEHRSAPGNPAATWTVAGTHKCARLARVLESTIRGKKAREFELWAATIEAVAADPRSARERYLSADVELKAARRYRSPVGRLRRVKAPRVTPQDSLRALEEFAARHAGPLASTSYMALRRRSNAHWPARNTVARHFGSWHKALEVAGLGHRGAREPERYANRSRAVIDARLLEQRERVLASVRRFVAEVGHVPRAMEYFRWRLERDPQTPTQATVYNLFPGGWNAVRDALVG